MKVQDAREGITGWDMDRAVLFMKGQAEGVKYALGHERFAQLCDLIFLEFNKLKEKEYETN